MKKLFISLCLTLGLLACNKRNADVIGHCGATSSVLLQELSAYNDSVVISMNLTRMSADGRRSLVMYADTVGVMNGASDGSAIGLAFGNPLIGHVVGGVVGGLMIGAAYSFITYKRNNW